MSEPRPDRPQRGPRRVRGPANRSERAGRLTGDPEHTAAVPGITRIVAVSDPAAEFEETAVKAAPPLSLLDTRFPERDPATATSGV